MRPPSPLLRLALLLSACLCLGACQAEAVRLYELRDADAGSPARAAYERLESATLLANEFLSSAPAAQGFPAEQARFLLDHTDVLLDLGAEGIQAVRISTAGWGDPRTLLGDGLHPSGTGFTTRRDFGAEASGDVAGDDAFLALEPAAMAATLLRQAVMMREITERGAFDYWLNYDLMGLDPDSGWREDNVVNQRAYAVERAFLEWHAQRG